jgi:hypothetical protein
MDNREKRLVFLHWVPMGKILVINVLPLIFCIVCVRLFVPANERPVFWAFVGIVSVGWALLIWGSSFLLTIWSYTLGGALKALGSLFSSRKG